MPQILLIEDNEHQRRIIRERLQSEGYEVTDTPFGDEGVKLAKSEHFDLVIIDIMVPHLDGWAVMKALREDPATRDIPYVVLSGAKASPPDIERSMALGAQSHFAKGVTPMDEVLQEIRLMLGLKKILILDANPQRANEIRGILQRHRFLTTVLSFGIEAINRAPRIKPDVLMLSNQVSGITPSIAIQRFRQLPGMDRLPIVFIAEQERPPLLAKGQTVSGIVAYPCPEEDLLQAVRKLFKTDE